MNTQTARSALWLGWACLGGALALWSLSFGLRCSGRATVVGGFALLEGAAFGTMLALVTRTRRPLLIYLYLFAAALSLWPLWAGWPPANPEEIHLWPNAPSLLENYFDVLRVLLFLLGIPYPFARVGYHASDLLPAAAETIPPEEWK